MATRSSTLADDVVGRALQGAASVAEQRADSIGRLRRRASRLEKQADALQAETDVIRRGNDRLMQVVRGGVDRIAMTRVEIDAEYGLAGVADDLQRAIDEADRVLADAETRLASERHQLALQSSKHDEQVADAKGAEMSRVAQLEELKRKVAAVTDEIAAVKAQNSKDLQDISGEFQKRMQDIEHDMVSLSGGAELQLRRKLMALAKENQQLQSQIASLTSKIDHANHHPAPRRRKRPLTITGSL